MPNVDVSEDVIKVLGSETRAVATGRGKTRIWQTARERMAYDPAFKPETDVRKLLEGMDSFKASTAGGQTFKAAIGGKTRLEVIQETHPALYKKMMDLRGKVQKLTGYKNVLRDDTQQAIDNFLKSPVEDIDLVNLQAELGGGLKPGRYVAKSQAGKTIADIQEEINAISNEKEASFRQAIRQHIRALPGVIELMNSLARNGFSLALASAAPMENVRLLTESLGINRLFQGMVSAEDVAEGKPNPQVFLLAAERLGVKPENCIVIEDAVAGVAAAKRAGMRCLAVTNTHPRASLAEADLIVDTLAEVTAPDLADLLKSS